MIRSNCSSFDGDLEEELMDLPENETSYLKRRDRAMSVPTHHEIKRNRSTFQFFRKVDENKSMISMQTSMNIRPALVQEVLENALARSRRRGSEAYRPSVFTALFVDLPSTEKQALAQLVDSEFIHYMKLTCSSMQKKQSNELKQRVIAHFNNIFHITPTTSPLIRPTKHSLGTVIFEFARVFHALYTDVIDTNQNEINRQIENDAACDVCEFSDLLVQVVKYKYPFLVPEYVHVIQQAVEEALFVHLQPTLHRLFVLTHRIDDFEMANIVATLNSKSMASMGVCPRFCLDQSSNDISNYGNAIAAMAELPGKRSPSSKIECVVEVCHLIDSSIKRYYSQSSSVLPVEKLNVTADELVPILSYILVRAGNPLCLHLVSYLSIMDSFMPDRFHAGEGAFSVTMLHGALTHIRSLC